jgi:hypothetical protein
MKRSSFFTALLFGFYLFYSLCPLLYSVSMAPAEERQGPDLQLTAAGRQSSVERSPTTDTSEVASDPSQILLIKKRAIGVSFKGLVGKLSLCPVKNSIDAIAKTFVPPDAQETTTCPGGFQFYHSGISPPSV